MLSNKEIASTLSILKELLGDNPEHLCKLLKENSNNEADELINKFLQIRRESDLYQMQLEFIDKVQETLFAYSQLDFSTKLDLVEGVDNLTALAYSINIHGEELSDVYTDLKENEIALEKSIAELQKAINVKDTFLAKMSHEMRTPLNSIIGFTDLLLESDVPTKEKEKLEIIHDQSADLLSLINNVLDLTKIKSDKFSFSNQSINLKTLLSRKVDSFARKAEENGSYISFHFDENIHPWYVIDKIRLGQIVSNLVNNAIKFTKNGRIDVSVLLKQSQTNTDVLTFCVSDTGIGIGEDDLKKICDPFVQVAKSDLNIQGTGLGLAIVQDLLHIMKSELKIKSQVDHGTRFYFDLLLTKSSVSEAADVDEAKINLKGLNCLIVDDNNFNRILLRHIVAEWGAKCFEAENGLEAIEMVQEEQFDIIFMDFQMPVMNGIDATIAIRKKLKLDTPIIGVTANTVERDAIRSLNSGMNGYVTKPIDRTLLVREITPHLH